MNDLLYMGNIKSWYSPKNLRGYHSIESGSERNSGGIFCFCGDGQLGKENREERRCGRNKEGESLKMTIQHGRCGTCVGV